MYVPHVTSDAVASDTKTSETQVLGEAGGMRVLSVECDQGGLHGGLAFDSGF